MYEHVGMYVLTVREGNLCGYTGTQFWSKSDYEIMNRAAAVTRINSFNCWIAPMEASQLFLFVSLIVVPVQAIYSSEFKGAVSRDFLSFFYFMNISHLGPW